jgi:hypothetical protein
MLARSSREFLDTISYRGPVQLAIVSILIVEMWEDRSKVAMRENHLFTDIDFEMAVSMQFLFRIHRD